MQKMMRLLVLLMLLIWIPACNVQQEKQSDTPKAPEPTLVQLATLSEETHVEERRFSGDVMPWSIVPLMFKVAGKIETLNIEEGQSVEEGQLLGTMETKDYALVRDLAKAQVDALSPHLKRVEALSREDALPKAKADELSGKMSLAKVQLQQANAQLSYTKLYAPVSGVIIQKKFDAGSLTSPEHPVAVIAEMKRVKIILPVSQRDLGYFSKDQEVDIETVENSSDDLERNRIYKGKVITIGFVADEKTRTFPITVEVPNPDLSLRAGMIVDVKIKVREVRGIFVPLECVTRDLTGNPSVFVADDQNVTHARKLQLGRVYGDRVHVLEGLSLGERVVVKGRAFENVPVFEENTAYAATNPSKTQENTKTTSTDDNNIGNITNKVQPNEPESLPEAGKIVADVAEQ